MLVQLRRPCLASQAGPTTSTGRARGGARGERGVTAAAGGRSSTAVAACGRTGAAAQGRAGGAGATAQGRAGGAGVAVRGAEI